MKKQLIIIWIVILFIIIILGGCTEKNTDNPDGDQLINDYDDNAFFDYLSNGSYEGIQMPSVDVINKNNTNGIRKWAESTIRALDENLTITVAFEVSDIYKPIQNNLIFYYNHSRNAAVNIIKACDAMDNESFNTSLNYFKNFNYYTNQSIIYLQTSLNLIRELEFKIKILGAWLAYGTSGPNTGEGTYIFFSNGTFLARSDKDVWGTFEITDKILIMNAENETFSYFYTFSENENKVTLIDESWTIILERQ